jgi:hypothetical protein
LRRVIVLGERCGTGGKVIGGFEGKRSRFEVWVVRLLWTNIFNARGKWWVSRESLKIPGGSGTGYQCEGRGPCPDKRRQTFKALGG